MKRPLRFLPLLLALVFALPAPAQVARSAPFHIGVVTGTSGMWGGAEDLRGAEELVRRYGAVADGGMIHHVTYPENFMDMQWELISQIVALAADPLMKAIVVNQSPPGTAEAFRRVRETRPDILLLAGEPWEDPAVIEDAADLAVNSDFLKRGYTIVWAAKELGARTFVHISFPRHMSYETLGVRRKIMEAACEELGLAFAFETAPDPTTEVGVAGAQEFMLRNVPLWLQKYGKDTAFFATNDALLEPLIRRLLEYGGIFVEADLPSPLNGYPGALGLDLSAEDGDYPAMLRKIEKAVVAGGGADRFGVWTYSYGSSLGAGLGEYAKRVVEGTATMGALSDLYAALGVFTPGAAWSGGWYIDEASRLTTTNHALVYMDTYIFGRGYLPTARIEVPEKFLRIRFYGP